MQNLSLRNGAGVIQTMLVIVIFLLRSFQILEFGVSGFAFLLDTFIFYGVLFLGIVLGCMMLSEKKLDQSIDLISVWFILSIVLWLIFRSTVLNIDLDWRYWGVYLWLPLLIIAAAEAYRIFKIL